MIADIIERKAVNVWGRLGTSYDAYTDRIIENLYVLKTNVQIPEKRSICKVFSGDRFTDVINYLEKINFDDALKQNLFLGVIEPSGVSSLINYKRPINENTRLLYFSYTTKIEELDLSAEKIDHAILRSPHPTTATHIITKIHWGIELLCVISISGEMSIETLDDLLQIISKRLENDDKKFILNDDERDQIKQLKNITVYGPKNCIKNPYISLDTVLNELPRWQRFENYHHPLLYIMNSLRQIYKDTEVIKSVHMNDEINVSIEKIRSIIQDFKVTRAKVNIKHTFEQCDESTFNLKLVPRSKDFQFQLSTLTETYQQLVKDYQKILVNLSFNICQSKEINQILSNPFYSLLISNLNALYENVEELVAKMKLIERLQHDHIEYINISDILSQEDKLKSFEEINAAIQSTLLKHRGAAILWYSSDRLKQESSFEWENKYQQFTLQNKQKAMSTPLIYIDFIEYANLLQDFIIVSLSDQITSAPTAQTSTQRVLPVAEDGPTQVLPSQTELNVLLLGETGVGKSTFINALVNYLTYNSLEEADNYGPAIVIPVSFVTASGNDFDEIVVKYGHTDANENLENEGESVTQQCRSYIFNLNNELRLRLIDTPGIGDTRGFDQDEINMKHILTYINQLSHINAVCLLLKPNSSKLDVLFRSCVRQLSTYLTPSGHGNIIFCFTNARSTQFSPGNTGSLLKRMLKEEQLEDVKFERKNTFFFDNESFRYLIVRKHDIEVNDFIRKESIESWKKSVAESIQMISYIQIIPSYDFDRNNVLKKAAFQILMLARPLMELLRLTLYNWKLCENGNTGNQITVKSNPVTIQTCSRCSENKMVQIALLHIVEYDSVRSETIPKCHCPFDENHFVVEYELKHELAFQSVNMNNRELENLFFQHLYNCDRLIHFLESNGLMNEVDPFSSIQKRFLDEEQYINSKLDNTSEMHQAIYSIWQSVPSKRQQNREILNGSKEKLSIDHLHELTNEFLTIPEVREQVECIKKSRELIMKSTEHHLKTSSAKTENVLLDMMVS